MFKTEKRMRLWLWALPLFYALALLLALEVSAQTMLPEAIPSVCNVLETDLERGSSDEETSGAVTALQDFLFDRGFYPRRGVGEFGWLTHFAVARFQAAHALPSTGFVGPLTRAAIRSGWCTPQTPNTGFVLGTTTATTTSAASTATTTKTQISLPYHRDIFRPYDGWDQDWGLVTTTPQGFLKLSATASTTGATAILQGSESWRDYTFTANIVANVNGSFSLIGRRADGRNYVVCTFGGQNVSITEVRNGRGRTVASVRLEAGFAPSAFISTNVGMRVKGNRIACSVTGSEDAVYTVSDPRLLTGGVGISIWHSVPNITSLELRAVRVDPL